MYLFSMCWTQVRSNNPLIAQYDKEYELRVNEFVQMQSLWLLAVHFLGGKYLYLRYARHCKFTTKVSEASLDLQKTRFVRWQLRGY